MSARKKNSRIFEDEQFPMHCMHIDSMTGLGWLLFSARQHHGMRGAAAAVVEKEI